MGLICNSDWKGKTVPQANWRENASFLICSKWRWALSWFGQGPQEIRQQEVGGRLHLGHCCVPLLCPLLTLGKVREIQPASSGYGNIHYTWEMNADFNHLHSIQFHKCLLSTYYVPGTMSDIVRIWRCVSSELVWLVWPVKTKGKLNMAGNRSAEGVREDVYCLDLASIPSSGNKNLTSFRWNAFPLRWGWLLHHPTSCSGCRAGHMFQVWTIRTSPLSWP